MQGVPEARGGACLIPKGWLPLAAEARRAGIPERTARRHALALHHQAGGGVVMSLNQPGTKARKYYINPEAAKRVVEQRDANEEPSEDDVTFGRHLVRIENLENRLFALRNVGIERERRLKRVEEALGIGRSVDTRRTSSATSDNHPIGAREHAAGGAVNPQDGEADP